MSLREVKKQAARDHVADLSAAMFVRDGYVATTTREIAKAAGVAEGTIFNLFGSKAELVLAALRRSLPTATTGEKWVAEAQKLPTARDVIEHFCITGKEVSDAALPMVRVLLEAASVDKTVATAWQRQEAYRYEVQQWLLTALADRGWLRTDRTFDDIARDLWMVAAPEMHIKWLDAGRSEGDFQAWRFNILCTLLLDPRQLM